uniref:NADH dehydrogenase subunit 6 n=1 Tax=Odoiporus longicollis TaxID=354431 RepID=UPI00200115A2|nr:NADH dehydrogenase subunit 6 [Odoiporus longicollis]UOL50375.1 NADH dehydrogenase subunit 6 [Odoiporus longicollis]
MLMNFLIINYLNNLIFIFLKHPISMGAMLLLQAIMVSLSTGMFYSNFWFSYILFIVMIGGMLVLFMYMTSVASNEKFKLMYSFLIPIIIIMLFLLINNFSDHFLSMNLSLINDLMNQSLNIYCNLFTLSKYINFPNIIMMILIMSYLLMTMIAIVKITDIKSGPLRQKL